jgi:hypothetical protein
MAATIPIPMPALALGLKVELLEVVTLLAVVGLVGDKLNVEDNTNEVEAVIGDPLVVDDSICLDDTREVAGNVVSVVKLPSMVDGGSTDEREETEPNVALAESHVKVIPGVAQNCFAK